MKYSISLFIAIVLSSSAYSKNPSSPCCINYKKVDIDKAAINRTLYQESATWLIEKNILTINTEKTERTETVVNNLTELQQLFSKSTPIDYQKYATQSTDLSIYLKNKIDEEYELSFKKANKLLEKILINIQALFSRHSNQCRYSKDHSQILPSASIGQRTYSLRRTRSKEQSQHKVSNGSLP